MSCLGCNIRTVGCHSDCKEYIMFKKELDKIKEAKISENKESRWTWNKYNRSYKNRNLIPEKQHHGLVFIDC